MKLNYLFVVLAIGVTLISFAAADRGDTWFVTRTCDYMHCGKQSSKIPSIFGDNCIVDQFWGDDKGMHQQHNPVVVAEKITCKPYPDSKYYRWLNRTGEIGQIQEWQCVDPNCVSCELVLERETGTPKEPCYYDECDRYYITNGEPNMEEYYWQDQDPNNNWVRKQIVSDTKIIYYPALTNYWMEDGYEGLYCTNVQCNGTSSVIEYYGQIQPHSLKCQQPETPVIVKEQLPSNVKCFQIYT